MFVADFIMFVFTFALLVGMFFLFDEVILKGYFAAKLRKRFNVEEVK